MTSLEVFNSTPEFSNIPLTTVIQQFTDSSGNVTGQISTQNGDGGTWLRFDCNCNDARPICRGHCCALKGAYLTPEETESGIYDAYPDPENGVMQLRRESDGFCVYFNREKRICGIYENRPQVCKTFHCTQGADVRGWKLPNVVHRNT